MTPEQKQRQRDRLRAEQPELVAALSMIPRECITAMVVTSDDGEVIARTDRPLHHDPADVWVSAESYLKMRKFGHEGYPVAARSAPKSPTKPRNRK